MALSPNRLRVLSAEEVPSAVSKSAKATEDRRCPISGRRAGFNQEPEDKAADVWVESGEKIYALCQGGHIVLLEGEVAAAESSASVLPSAETIGDKTVIYIIAKCSDETAYPQTTGDAATKLGLVNDYFKACSWNQTKLISWDIVEVVLPKTKAVYTAAGSSAFQTDARNAAKALDAKYTYTNYTFDMINLTYGILGTWGGLGAVGRRGIWLQTTSWSTAAHELGHNYGLLHANFWNTGDTSVIGAGANAEYGDPFSEMGGSGQFSGYEKSKLDWIPTANIQTMTSSGTYRVYACDTSTAATSGIMYGLRITKDSIRDYWITHRQEFSNQWNRNGVLLHWDPWEILDDDIHESNGGAQLLDTTPGSTLEKIDAAIVCGRTFSDFDAGIHITPMSVNSGTTPSSIDVVVNVGSFSGNRSPVVSVSADSMAAATNATVTFNAIASDPDGDPLAIYWDFGENNFAFNTTSTTKSWATKNDYPVRVIVSDMKGGTASATVIITVGTVTKFRISGTVRSNGIGVGGVRVFTGDNVSPVWTNSDGTYSLVNRAAGNYTVQAIGYNVTYTAGFSNPVSVGPDATTKDFSEGNVAPTIANIASASPNTVTASTATLSVLGADDGPESDLTYFWSTTGTVPASVNYSVNNSNAAKSTVVTFTKSGTYPMLVTVTDQGGLTASSAVTVTVNQTLSTVSVSPATVTVAPLATQAFTASGRDQFGFALVTSPAFTWAVASGGVVSSGGVFTAGNTAGGPHTLTVSTGGKSTTAAITVNNLPTISAIAAQQTLPATALGPISFTIGDVQTAALSLILTKQTSSSTLIPSGNIVFGGSDANRTVTITPATGEEGTATITITVRDAHNGTASTSFNVTVAAAGTGGGGDGGGGKKKCGFGNGIGVLMLLIFAFGVMRLRQVRR
jgi:PKD domain/Gametolysin peptidase M11